MGGSGFGAVVGMFAVGAGVSGTVAGGGSGFVLGAVVGAATGRTVAP